MATYTAVHATIKTSKGQAMMPSTTQSKSTKGKSTKASK